MRELIKLFKMMWKFVTEEPAERTDEEWEQYFAIAKTLRYHHKNARRYKHRKRWM